MNDWIPDWVKIRLEMQANQAARCKLDAAQQYGQQVAECILNQFQTPSGDEDEED